MGRRTTVTDYNSCHSLTIGSDKRTEMLAKSLCLFFLFSYDIFQKELFSFFLCQKFLFILILILIVFFFLLLFLSISRFRWRIGRRRIVRARSRWLLMLFLSISMLFLFLLVFLLFLFRFFFFLTFSLLFMRLFTATTWSWSRFRCFLFLLFCFVFRNTFFLFFLFFFFTFTFYLLIEKQSSCDFLSVIFNNFIIFIKFRILLINKFNFPNIHFFLPSFKVNSFFWFMVFKKLNPNKISSFHSFQNTLMPFLILLANSTNQCFLFEFLNLLKISLLSISFLLHNN